MSEDQNHFDDPGLKDALQKLHGSHKASDQLRAMVVQRLAAVALPSPAQVEHKSSDRPSMKLHSSFRPLRWLAAAAVVALCVGGVWQYQHHRAAQALNDAYAANDELLDSMVDAHKTTAQSPAEMLLTSSLTDPGALANEASGKLGRTVPIVNLASLGWSMDHASLCQVNKLNSVRFHFHRGTQAITVISMPSTAWANGKDGSSYNLIADGAPIAGYISGKSLNCVVGDSSIQPAEAGKLIDFIRGS